MRVNQETKWKFIVVYREVVKYIVKYSLRRAGGQGLKGSKRTPGLPPSPGLPRQNASLNPALARWRSNLGSCGVLGCPVGMVWGGFRAAKGNSRVTKQNFGLLRWEIFDNSFHPTPLRFIPPHQNSFPHTSLHPTSFHFQKFQIQTIKKERLCDAWSIFI